MGQVVPLELYNFSYSDEELAKIEKLPAAIFSKKVYISKDAYLNTAYKIDALLRKTIDVAGGTYIKLKSFSDGLGDNVQLFSSPVHFTHEGADVLAKEIARQMMMKLSIN